MTDSTRASSRPAKPGPAQAGLSSGDYVTNDLKPEWGPGRVVEMERGNAFVFFRDRPGKEVIRMKPHVLRAAESDEKLAAIAGFVEKDGGYKVAPVKRVPRAKKEATA